MKTIRYGDEKAEMVLIQMVDDHDLAVIDAEIGHIRALAPDKPFMLVACKVENWNEDLSPWEAPPVFGEEGFGGGAGRTLSWILEELIPELEECRKRKYIIGGYSLAGLFALWAACRTDRFYGVAAASPSVWFPGFSAYVREHPVRSGNVYLSLGDKEEKTKNPIMASVGDAIRGLYAQLSESTLLEQMAELPRPKGTAAGSLLQEGDTVLLHRGINTILEWNAGGHFKESDLRTAKAFSWILNKRSIHVAAAVIYRDGKIFSTQRGYGQYKDWWEFPGGKVEPGEEPEGALVREIREELDAEIRIIDKLITVEYDYPEHFVSMDCFLCEVPDGHMALLEHEAAAWLPVGDLWQVRWLPADDEVLKTIEERYKS